MIKKIKIISILSIFLLCGCDVSYNLTIEEDLTLTENIVFSEDNDTILKHHLDLSDGLKSIINYNIPIDNVEDDINIDKNLELKIKEGASSSQVIFERGYEKLESYQNSEFLVTYFEDKQIEILEDTVIVFAKKIRFDDINNLVNSQNEGQKLNTFKVDIIIPFKVYENNADYVNNNVYSWNFDQSSIDKSIRIVFDKNDITNPLKKENKTFEEILNDISGTDNGFIWLWTGIGLLLIVIVIIFISRKIKKGNKI